jgi:hypothetical protein
MPQSLNQKAVNNFVRGLITEAGELTFPEGASVDELNCDLRRDGSRRRRLGVAYEDGNILSSFTLSDSELVTTGDWTNVAGNAELEFLVVQKGATLYFYNKSTLPYSGQVESNSVNLASYEQAGSAGAETVKCQFASIKGTLVVSSPAINTIFIEYNETGGTFTVNQISFKTRDFDFQGDTEDYFDETTTGTASDARIYDSLNSGWADTNNGRTGSSLTYYFTTESQYPALTHPWFSGKTASDEFDIAGWKKIGAGTSLSGNGRYVLDFFNKNRQAAVTGSGFSVSIANEIETTRFRCVESFSGRIFYSGLESSKNAGTILFSKLIETTSDLGKCHQINDPTSEYISDLLATDGGEIKIPDAVKIQKLYAYQNSLFIFAENGIWQITGVDGVFKADAFAVNRVSRIGLLNPETFVAAEGVPFWWSRFGIHTLSSDPVSGQGQEQNLTIPTIQSRWDAIDADAKLKVTGVYDSINKRIYWAYPDANETVEAKLNNFLILDIPLQAFFPWKVSDQASSTDAVVGLAFYSGYGAKSLELDVTANNGVDDVVTSAGDDVVSEQVSTFNSGDPAIILICRDGATNKITMGGFTGIDFLDWGDTNYTSFAETGYDFVGDLVTKKNAPYIVTYCRLTETGFTGNENDGYEAVRPSSALLSSAWDFKDTFGTGQQIYRKKFPVVVDPSDLDNYNYPEDMITSRVKVRGHGRSMRLRYESEQGKDFILVGWGIIQGRNPRF